MHDIVGIKIITKDKRETGFITFGRIFGRIDETELLEVIKSHCHKYEHLENNIESIKVCWSLIDISHLTYFYECYWKISQTKIPFGPKYDKWVEKIKKEMQLGQHLYFLGISKGNLTNVLMDKLEPVLKKLSDS